MSTWVLPYVDQPLDFWAGLAAEFGAYIREVYFPISSGVVATGRGPQPEAHMDAFLRDVPLEKAVLVNPIILTRPVEEIAPRVLAALRRLRDEYGVQRVTVASLALARAIRAALPDFHITASVLMGIATPAQAMVVGNTVDAIAPDNRLVRDLAGLRRLREAFRGEIRLIVNEACIPGCPYRTQHFYEMSYGDWLPQSLCDAMLAERPWLRLTGAWILPRHLGYYEGLHDTLKLAGRVTLRDRQTYLRVLGAYVRQEPVLPRDIGGGPASVLAPIDISDELFAHTLHCAKDCHACTVCREYYDHSIRSLGR